MVVAQGDRSQMGQAAADTWGEMVMMRTDTSHMRPSDNAGVPCGMSSSLLMHPHPPLHTRTHTYTQKNNGTYTHISIMQLVYLVWNYNVMQHNVKYKYKSLKPEIFQKYLNKLIWTMRNYFLVLICNDWSPSSGAVFHGIQIWKHSTQFHTEYSFILFYFLFRHV